MIARRKNQRHDQEVQRAEHLGHAGAEKIIDFSNIVGGARHGITHRLQVVEGHALAKQIDVEFVTDIPLNTLGDPFKAEIAAELNDAADEL